MDITHHGRRTWSVGSPAPSSDPSRHSSSVSTALTRSLRVIAAPGSSRSFVQKLHVTIKCQTLPSSSHSNNILEISLVDDVLISLIHETSLSNRTWNCFVNPLNKVEFSQFTQYHLKQISWFVFLTRNIIENPFCLNIFIWKKLITQFNICLTSSACTLHFSLLLSASLCLSQGGWVWSLILPRCFCYS